MQVPLSKSFSGGYLAEPRLPRGQFQRNVGMLYEVAATQSFAGGYLYAYWSGLINQKTTSKFVLRLYYIPTDKLLLPVVSRLIIFICKVVGPLIIHHL